VSRNLGESRTTQAVLEFILQFSVLSFCSLEREEKRKKKEEKERNYFPAVQLGLLCTIKS
jgi:hypothetical protein